MIKAKKIVNEFVLISKMKDDLTQTYQTFQLFDILYMLYFSKQTAKQYFKYIEDCFIELKPLDLEKEDKEIVKDVFVLTSKIMHELLAIYTERKRDNIDLIQSLIKENDLVLSTIDDNSKIEQHINNMLPILKQLYK